MEQKVEIVTGYRNHEFKIGQSITFKINGFDGLVSAIVDEIKDEFTIILRDLSNNPSTSKAIEEIKSSFIKTNQSKIPFWANDYRRKGKK